MLREQKRAFLSMILAGVILLAFIFMFTFNDPATLNEDKPLRMIFTSIIVGGAILWGIIIASTKKQNPEEAVAMDERDVIIARNALKTQLWASMITLVVWCIVLTETYWTKGAVPVDLMYIMMQFILFTNLLARSIVIFRGYKNPNLGIEEAC